MEAYLLEDEASRERNLSGLPGLTASAGQSWTVAPYHTASDLRHNVKQNHEKPHQFFIRHPRLSPIVRHFHHLF